MSRFTHVMLFVAVSTLLTCFLLVETHASIASTPASAQVISANYAPSVSEKKDFYVPPVSSQNRTLVKEIYAKEEDARTEDVDIFPENTQEKEEVPLHEEILPELPEEVQKVEVPPEPSEEPVEVFVSETRGFQTLSEEINELSNRAREREGESAFILDGELSTLATKRSEDMIRNDYFSHTAPDGCGLECNFLSSGYASVTWGENIAEYEPLRAVDIDELPNIFVKNWLKSEGHRENILSSEFTHEGVGVASDGERIVVTVIFGRPL